MLFVDKLRHYRDIMHPQMETLLETACRKQSHTGDLLVLYANGAYKKDPPDTREPFKIGPGTAGWSEYTHYKFIVAYREASLHGLTFEQYSAQLSRTPEKRELIEDLTERETISVQMEMLIYLKFWEADSYIKWFSQFLRLVHGEPYDWTFKIKSFRDPAGKSRKNIWKEDVIHRFCKR